MAKKNEDGLIETVDENGNVVTFELFDIVDVEGQEYALLLPEEHQEDDEMVLMRLIMDGEDYVFEAIDDDAEFEKVSGIIEQMEDEEE